MAGNKLGSQLTSELVLPVPIGLQPLWLDSPASRKVLRVGRRGSKTRFALVASLAGHGPGREEFKPKFPGVMQGTRARPIDVVWISPTYGNLSTVLWREEIIPRISPLSWAKLDTVHHDVHLDGHGSLLLRSGDREAIDSVRGIGNRLGGVIIDEAAWMDLRGALLDIILPALADNGGWLIIMSTTNAGQDGGYKDDGSPQLPSYFNLICEEIRSGKRGPEWVEFTGTAYDNPVMNREAIDELVKEYTPDSPKLKQEVFAELLTTGVGLALPELSQVHWTDDPLPSASAEWFGGFDWGYNHPWALPFGWRDADGYVTIRDTIWGRHDEPDEIAAKSQTGLSGAPVKHIWSSNDAWALKGRSIGAGIVTIGGILEESGLPFVKAVADSDPVKKSQLDNLRRYLKIPEKGPPLLRFARTPGNERLMTQLAAMQLDPKDPEKALKVDADSAGRGGDDGFEALCRMMSAYPVHVRVPKQGPDVKQPDRASPLRVENGKLVKQVRPQTITEMMDLAEQHLTRNRTIRQERLPRNRRYS
jgi:hypothetical protein